MHGARSPAELAPVTDALVRLCETCAARALAGGGDDPFIEVHRCGTRADDDGLGMALLDVYEADPEGRGRAYLLDLFAASEPPPPCHLEGLVEDPETATLPPFPNHSVWCEAIAPPMNTRGPGDPRSKKPRGIPGAPRANCSTGSAPGAGPWDPDLAGPTERRRPASARSRLRARHGGRISPSRRRSTTTSAPGRCRRLPHGVRYGDLPSFLRGNGRQDAGRNMTSEATWRVVVAVALAGFLAPDALSAQEREIGEVGWVPGLVLDEGGGWRVPTADEALRALRGDPTPSRGPAPENSLVVALLRGEHGPRPESERAGLVEALVEIAMVDAESSSREHLLRSRAYAALARAQRDASHLGGTPYPEAFDALVRLYETRAARLLAGGGEDPFREGYRSGPSLAARRLGGALGRVYLADPEGRGRDYVRALFEASEPFPPPVCRRGSVFLVVGPDGEYTAESRERYEAHRALPECPRPYNPSVWCEAGRYLMFEPGATRPRRPDDVADPPDPEAFKELCFPGR